MARLDTFDEQTRTRLKDCPPSAKLVYLLLADDGPLTQKQLAEQSLMSARTVRNALTELQERGLVTSERYPSDARQKLFTIATP